MWRLCNQHVIAKPTGHARCCRSGLFASIAGPPSSGRRPFSAARPLARLYPCRRRAKSCAKAGQVRYSNVFIRFFYAGGGKTKRTTRARLGHMTKIVGVTLGKHWVKCPKVPEAAGATIQKRWMRLSQSVFQPVVQSAGPGQAGLRRLRENTWLPMRCHAARPSPQSPSKAGLAGLSSY